LRVERDAHWVRAREMFAHVPGFPTVKTLDDFDFSFATGVPRKQIHELAGSAFIVRPRQSQPPVAPISAAAGPQTRRNLCGKEHRFRIQIRCHE